MCGIIGYIGKRQALPFLIDGLKKLEYRGYDSAGFCVKEGRKFILFKKEGTVSNLETGINSINIPGNCGIAHTRWATHGQPNSINAHPHLDCTGQIAIVHNGIVENYNALKELLQKEGHSILSETDSEIIAHLIEKFYSGDIESATIKALQLIEGPYALAVLDKNSEKIIAAKKGSPLIVAKLEEEYFVTSDIAAIVAAIAGQTKVAAYLNDNEMVVLTKDAWSFKNFNGDSIDKKICQVSMNIGQIEKRGFKHFMLKEIFEQPLAIENTLRGRINEGKIKLSVDVDSIKKIMITACGTSWHSALMGKYLIEKIAGFHIEVDYASEFRYRNPFLGFDELLVAISQSGETADTLAALQYAKSQGNKTLGIVNVVGSTIAREVNSGIYLHAGPEIGVASTKAFTCQVTALILLAMYLRQHNNYGFREEDEDFLEELNKVPQKIKEVLKQSGKIRKLAEIFKDSRNFYFLGRNLNFPVALEGALKLKEISYIHAEGYPAAEMKHGPIALVDENMPVVFICPHDHVYNKILSNMEEIKARGGNIIAIINKDDDRIKKLAKYIIKVPESIDELSPLINVVPLQLLAYHIADLKGLNVDRPRNLAKSVTVE